MDRRSFLAAASAALLAAPRGWAAAGSPDWIAAAQAPDGGYALFGLTAAGEAAFRIPLPGRGHAAAAHPHRPLAVAFARRPGDFALVVDCAEGRETARLTAPEGRHFYGHGAFSADGARLFTTENAYETGEGRLGVWDARSWTRLDEIPSGGVGPHEVLRVGERLAVGNGGIMTHPATGRAKLNLPEMRPNLTWMSVETGEIEDQAEPPHHHLSTRHIAAREDGLLAVVMQWQGRAAEAPSLLALHRPGEGELTLLSAPREAEARMQGYGGSVAFSGDGAQVGITSPKGGVALRFSADDRRFLGLHARRDVCGAAAAPGGLLLSDGLGGLERLADDGRPIPLARHEARWDNHLVALGTL